MSIEMCVLKFQEIQQAGEYDQEQGMKMKITENKDGNIGWDRAVNNHIEPC